MLDRRFHRALHLGAQRRYYLAVTGCYRPLALRQTELLQALLHDPHRLTHLFHADEIAVIAVAVLADGDVEVELVIAFIGLGLAQVPGRSRSSEHDTREAPAPGFIEADDTDIDIALLEDAVVGQEPLHVVAFAEERLAELP